MVSLGKQLSLNKVLGFKFSRLDGSYEFPPGALEGDSPTEVTIKQAHELLSNIHRMTTVAISTSLVAASADLMLAELAAGTSLHLLRIPAGGAPEQLLAPMVDGFVQNHEQAAKAFLSWTKAGDIAAPWEIDSIRSMAGELIASLTNSGTCVSAAQLCGTSVSAEELTIGDDSTWAHILDTVVLVGKVSSALAWLRQKFGARKQPAEPTAKFVVDMAISEELGVALTSISKLVAFGRRSLMKGDSPKVEGASPMDAFLGCFLLFGSAIGRLQST